MAASVTPWSAGPGVARAPESPLLWAVALAGCAAAAVSVQLALASDHVADPGLQAALLAWVKNDAEFIAARIAAHANHKPAAAGAQPATGGRPRR